MRLVAVVAVPALIATAAIGVPLRPLLPAPSLRWRRRYLRIAAAPPMLERFLSVPGESRRAACHPLSRDANRTPPGPGRESGSDRTRLPGAAPSDIRVRVRRRPRRRQRSVVGISASWDPEPAYRRAGHQAPPVGERISP